MRAKNRSNEIYLDYNATTPLDPKVADAMRPFLDQDFGNPSSNHTTGRVARIQVDIARLQVAEMLGCSSEEIIFTSGGTESNNLALIGTAFANREKGNHIITTEIEHPAVLEVCDYLASHGYDITRVPVNRSGRVNPADIAKSITGSTVLISVMHANNEIGTIQPLKEISKLAHSLNIVLHTDAAQSIGKIPVKVDDLGVDLLSIAGHKIFAPKGIGALYIRKGVSIRRTIHGAGQENDLRPGTENVMAITGLGIACEAITKFLPEYSKHMQEIRNLLQDELILEFPDLVINGDAENGLPNTLSVSFANTAANLILGSMQGVAASAGAACHENDVELSHVLSAMAIPEYIAMGTIRFSVGRITKKKEIMDAIPKIKLAVETARKMAF